MLSWLPLEPESLSAEAAPLAACAMKGNWGLRLTRTRSTLSGESNACLANGRSLN